MKKQLTEELISLAEKVIELKKKNVISASELKLQARLLYEKLSILDFTEKNLASVESAEPVPPKKEEASSLEKKPNENDQQDDDYAPSGLQFNDSDAITEPNTEKIKDIVAQMPPETARIDEMFENVRTKKVTKNDMEDIGGVHYDHLPQFEPARPKGNEPEKPKSLNDRLKNSIQIGVNERHAFVKNLFDGSTSDYNRVLSQLNTIKNKEEAVNFVLNMVKPDYNNWEGKEEYEIRFLALVEHKFE